MLAARMRLVSTDRAAPGYVLTLRDVTADLASQARRDALLSDVFDRMRRSAANLQMIVGVQAPGEAGRTPLDDALRPKSRRSPVPSPTWPHVTTPTVRKTRRRARSAPRT